MSCTLCSTHELICHFHVQKASDKSLEHRLADFTSVQADMFSLNFVRHLRPGKTILLESFQFPSFHHRFLPKPTPQGTSSTDHCKKWAGIVLLTIVPPPHLQHESWLEGLALEGYMISCLPQVRARTRRPNQIQFVVDDRQ